MKKFILFYLFTWNLLVSGQSLITPFEKSGGRETATYFECINFYKELDKTSSKITIKKTGISDAGYPYHIILYSNDEKFDPVQWHRQNKIVILIINGIHAGEPDGV